MLLTQHILKIWLNLILKNTTGTPLTDAGIVVGITTGQVRAGNNSDLIVSNWIAPTYTASISAPSSNPTDKTHWYHGGFEADIMIHDGTTWNGYQNITDARGFALGSTSPDGVIFSTTAPTQQSDESALVNGDLWIDTSDLENYPSLYRRETIDGEQKWVAIDKTDNTTEDGILFADARFMGDGTTDVITGTIKANFPTRISFQVTSKIDSRTILGEMGAEQLLGMGDMLYMAGGSKITRCHGPFVSDEEVEEIVNHLKAFGPPEYKSGVVDGPTDDKVDGIDQVLGLTGNTDGEDAIYDQAVAIVVQDRKCSTSYIQRKLAIGYNKAARLVEQMEDQGLVSPANHVGKREILIPEQSTVKTNLIFKITTKTIIKA